MAPRMRFVRLHRMWKFLELMHPKDTGSPGQGVLNTPIFKTSAVIRAWLPRLRFATVGNAF